jgi:hypothetical protein
MFEANKFIYKTKPVILKLARNSKFVAKKLIKKLKSSKISRHKIKNIINALDESKATRIWLRMGLLIILSGIIIKKVAEVYDEEKTFKQNLKGLSFYVKKLKKRIKNHGC